VNETAQSAIDQIHQKKYYYGLEKQGYKGKVLLVGINLRWENKKYSSIIEEYKCNIIEKDIPSTNKNKRKYEKKSNESSSKHKYNLRSIKIRKN